MQLRNMGKFQYDDVPTLGHLVLDRQRELLGYARVAQHEMPKLVGEFLALSRCLLVIW